jgi:hypothetical protein
LRLASLLWRLRRATAIETGLLQIRCAKADAAGRIPIRRTANGIVFAIRKPMPPSSDEDSEPDLAQADLNVQIAARFLTLNLADSGVFERLNRYETALWRQIGQLLVTLEFLRRYPPS